MTLTVAAQRCLHLWLLTTLVFFAAAPPATRAQDPGYLGNLPSAEQVLARFGGGDPVQALGRQCAALNILERRFFRSNAIQTREVAAHPATKGVQMDYRQAFIRLREQYAAAVGGIDDEKQRAWSAMCENRSPQGLQQPILLEEVLALLPPDVVAGYAAAFERSDGLVAAENARQTAARQAAAAQAARADIARTEAAEEQRAFRGIALAVLATGAILFIWSARTMFRIGKYQFENTTEGGVIQYKTYGAAIRQSLVGQLSGLGLLIGGLTTMAGIVMLLST